MSDLYIDALGIADEVRQLRATLPRGKRSKVLDEDFHPTLHPMHEDESARVITAVRQATSSRHILEKLLQRIAMTDDVGVHKACVKLHGFVILAGVLDEWADDVEVVTLALRCLAKWPLLARDKVVDAGVDAQVRRFADGDGETHVLAQSLLDAWDKLESTFRIARRAQADAADADAAATPPDVHAASWAARRRAEAEAAHRAASTARAPDAVSSDLRALLGYREQDDAAPAAPAAKAAAPKPAPPPQLPPPHDAPAPKPALSIDDIIRRANEANEAQQRLEAEEAARAAQAAADAEARAAKRRERASAPAPAAKKAKAEPAAPAAPAVDAAALEKQLAKQVGALVVKQLSKHKHELDRERFKRHAKELTRTLCSKEMRNPKTWPPRTGHVELGDEKRRKMKMFAHDYIKKLVQHHAKRARSVSTNPDDSSRGTDATPGDASMDASFADTTMDVSLTDTTWDTSAADVSLASAPQDAAAASPDVFAESDGSP